MVINRIKKKELELINARKILPINADALIEPSLKVKKVQNNPTFKTQRKFVFGESKIPRSQQDNSDGSSAKKFGSRKGMGFIPRANKLLKKS